MKLNYFLFLLTLIYEITASSPKLKTIYEWKYVNVTPVPSEYGIESFHEDNGIYYIKKAGLGKLAYFNYRKAIPFDVEKSKDGRTFVTIVAKKDVRVSLATITEESMDYGPLLAPFPDYSWFVDKTDCSKIINVRSVAIDKCNRLWALDTGRIENETQVCDTKLLVFDLETNELLESHPMPRDVSRNITSHRGILVNPVIHSEDSECKNNTVYIADSEGSAIVVFYNSEYRRFNRSRFDPKGFGKFNIEGISFFLPGSIVPMDIEPEGHTVIAAVLSSHDLTSIRLNVTAAVFNGTQNISLGVADDMFSSQPTALRMTKDKTLLVGLAESSIVCYNLFHKPCKKHVHTLITDHERLQYITAMKILPPANSDQEVLLMSTRLQKIINGTRNFNEINFRILNSTVNTLLDGTECKNNQADDCIGGSNELIPEAS